MVLPRRRPAASSPSTGGGTDTDWWVRSVVGWHVAFAVVLAIGGVVVLVGPTTRPLLAGVMLVAVAVGYAVNGAGGTVRRSGHARPYLLVLVVCLGVAFSAEPGLDFLLFLAFPQTWLLTDGWREGTAWTVALATSATVGLAVAQGPGSGAGVAASLGVSVAFSCALGIWITKVIDQSRERAGLIAELESARAALAVAHHEAGVAAERARLARDIHDTLAQGFTSIVLLAQAAASTADERTRPRIEQIEESAREGLADSRTLVAALTPVALSDAGLAEALHRLADRVSRESGVVIAVDVREGALVGLTRSQEVVLLRAAQEALSNVRRHAAARSARVRLDRGPDGVQLEVVDDGVGLPADPEAAGGFGLTGMRRRAEEAGGHLDLTAAAGGGTRVRLAVPGPAPWPGPPPTAGGDPAP